MRSYEIEKAAHAFRARLELASLKAARGWASRSLEELDGARSVVPATPSSAQSSGSSTTLSPPATTISATPVEARGEREQITSAYAKEAGSVSGNPAPERLSQNSSTTNVQHPQPPHGLAEGATTPEAHAVPSSAAPGAAASSSATSRSPDLFAMVLGDADLTLNANKTACHATASPSKASPARGTSRTLHMLASSPQLGSTARTGGTGRIPPHFDPHNSTAPHPRTPAHASPSRRQPFASPTTGSRSRVASANAPGTPSRGTLPNGHAASSLAYDLGLAREAGMPKRNSTLTTDDLNGLAIRTQPNSRTGVQPTDLDNQAQLETDRVAAVLASMADKRPDSSMSPPSKPRDLTPGGVPFTSAGATTRANGSFVEPSGLTPRRKAPMADKTASSSHSTDLVASRTPRSVYAHMHPQSPRSRLNSQDEEAGETAAHSLLDLAHSPSPAQEFKFKGATPSLWKRHRPSLSSQRLADAVGHGFSGSSGEGSDKAASSVGRALWPDSDEEQSSSSPYASAPSSQETTASGLAPAAPLNFDALPRNRKAQGPTSQQVEPANLPEDKLPGAVSNATADQDASEQDRRSSTASMSTSPDRSSCSQRAPTTPPRVLEGPSTPGAPGPKRAVDLTNPSDFSLQEFLNVSPSPKPRSRLHSGQFTPSSTQLEGGVWLDAPTSSWNLGHADDSRQNASEGLTTVFNTHLNGAIPLHAQATPPRPARSRFSTLDQSHDGMRSLLDSGFATGHAAYYKSPRLRDSAEEEDTPSKKRRRVGLFAVSEETSD